MRSLLVVLLAFNLLLAAHGVYIQRHATKDSAAHPAGQRVGLDSTTLTLASEAGLRDSSTRTYNGERSADAPHLFDSDSGHAILMDLLQDTWVEGHRVPAVPLVDPFPANAGDQFYLAGSGINTTARCIKAGPFITEEAALKAMQGMDPYVTDGELQSDFAEGRPVFWVHIPPRKSREEAQRVVQALKLRGIASFLIVDKGPLEGGVSLGVFHDAGSANRYALKMKTIEFPVRVYSSTTPQQSYHVVASIHNGSQAGIPGALLELVRQQEPSAVVEEVPCTGVAIE